GRSQVLNEDIIRQIKEVHDAVIINKPETVSLSLSSFNIINWRAFSRKTGIKIEWLDKELPNEATDIEADACLPFNLSGGTDVILTETAALRLPETGIRAVIELIRVHKVA
ncbi:9724_t:CDS:2, partial [Paraglomus brasilianum]